MKKNMRAHRASSEPDNIDRIVESLVDRAPREQRVEAKPRPSEKAKAKPVYFDQDLDDMWDNVPV